MRELFGGTNAPFLAPLVGNDLVSSGGFYCYLPLPFQHAIKIKSNATSGSFYYNIGYHLYSADTKSVKTWTGSEDSSVALKLWKRAGLDPKEDAGNTTISKSFDLHNAAEPKTLLDVAEPAPKFQPSSCPYPEWNRRRNHPQLPMTGARTRASASFKLP